jgi:hypothetical protein
LDIPRLRRRAVRVIVSGGLGNQLFQYAGAKWLATKLRAPLKIDARLPGFNARHGHFFYDEFRVEGPVLRTNSKSSLSSILARLEIALYHRVSLVFRSRGAGQAILGFHKALLGYDENFSRLSRPVVFRGNLQTHRYADEIREALLPVFILRDPSNWFLQLERESSEKRVLFLHVRRGDYVRSSKTLGLLSIDYYQAAIEELSSRGFSWDEIWIFSDSVSQVSQELANLDLYGPVIFIEPPKASSPAESLVLMSKCSLGIIANSTFSWWGAYSSNTLEAVVAPKKWFRAKPDPLEICPGTWIRVDSSWVSTVAGSSTSEN